MSPETVDSDYWRAYYDVTAERPAWRTLITAAEAFGREHPSPTAASDPPRLAVDLGCGAGRDTRELLRRGWRVIAVDREKAAIDALLAATPATDRPRLDTVVADLAAVEIPPCDLVNASVSLPFLGEADFWATWDRALSAIRPGGRLSAMLFGDRDASAGDGSLTCPSVEAIRDSLTGWLIEDWDDREEDGRTALGEPHHFHMIELVAKRPR